MSDAARPATDDVRASAEEIRRIARGLLLVADDAEAAGLKIRLDLHAFVERRGDAQPLGVLSVRPGADPVAKTMNGRPIWGTSDRRAGLSLRAGQEASSLSEAFRVLTAGAPSPLGGRPDIWILNGVPFHIRFKIDDGALIVSSERRQAALCDGNDEDLLLFSDGRPRMRAQLHANSWTGTNLVLDALDRRDVKTREEVAQVLIELWLKHQDDASAHRRAAAQAAIARLAAERLQPMIAMDAGEAAHLARTP